MINEINEKLKIIPASLLEEYKFVIQFSILAVAFDNLQDAEISTDKCSFYTLVPSVFSSKIEGENIELDSSIKQKIWH